MLCVKVGEREKKAAVDEALNEMRQSSGRTIEATCDLPAGSPVAPGRSITTGHHLSLLHPAANRSKLADVPRVMPSSRAVA